MSRHAVLFSLTIVVLVLLFSGCGGKGGNELVLMLHATPDQLVTWNAVVQSFTESTQIPVRIENEPNDTYESKLRSRITTANPPDVVYLAGTHIPEFADAGALINLNTYLAKSTLKANDFYAPAWQGFQYHGNTYGIPNDVDILTIAINEELCDLAMVRIPKNGWTWADYLKSAKAMSAVQNNNGTEDTWGTQVCPWWQVYVWQNGGQLVDTPNNPQRSTMATPAVEQALQFLADLTVKEKVAPRRVAPNTPDRLDAFRAGRVGMIYITHADVPILNKECEIRWSTVAIPQGKKDANLGLSWGYGITKASKQQDQAWKLVEFLAGTPGQKLLMNGSFCTPAREDISNSEYFGGGMNGDAPAYKHGYAIMQPLPATPHYAELNDIYEQELEPLWTGQATVDAVCKKIDARVNQLLQQQGKTAAWLRLALPMG